MGSVVVANSDPTVIWLGTGSDGVRSNVSTGRGVYRSTDAGKTWAFKGLYNAGQLGPVRVPPTNPDALPYTQLTLPTKIEVYTPGVPVPRKKQTNTSNTLL